MTEFHVSSALKNTKALFGREPDEFYPETFKHWLRTLV